MKAALLSDRGMVKVSGDDALAFLNGLLTSDIETLTPSTGRYAALLTPQGKIVVDVLVTQSHDAFYLDCPRSLASQLAQKLGFYKLRAKVAVEDCSARFGVLAVWDGVPALDDAIGYVDPRLPALGSRILVDADGASQAAIALNADLADASSYEAHRIALGVPKGGVDFAYGDAFPHEADMDQLGGVDFKKGCYVGQEVVSRMEHRGTARTRIVAVQFDGPAPDAGTSVTAGGKALGTLGSSAAGHGLALLRLDRVADALAAGEAIVADAVTLSVATPPWARFALPGSVKAAE